MYNTHCLHIEKQLNQLDCTGTLKIEVYFRSFLTKTIFLCLPTLAVGIANVVLFTFITHVPNDVGFALITLTASKAIFTRAITIVIAMQRC